MLCIYFFTYLLPSTFSTIWAFDDLLDVNSASSTPPSCSQANQNCALVPEEENQPNEEIFRNRVHKIVRNKNYDWKRAQETIKKKYSQEVQTLFKKSLTVSALRKFYGQRYEEYFIQPFTPEEDKKLLDQYNRKVQSLRIRDKKNFWIKKEFYLYLADVPFKGRKPTELKKRVTHLLRKKDPKNFVEGDFSKQFKSHQGQDYSEISLSEILEEPVCNTPQDPQDLEEEDSNPPLITNLSISPNFTDPLFYHPLFSLINRPEKPLLTGFDNNPFLFFHNPFTPAFSFNALTHLIENFPKEETPAQSSMHNLNLSFKNLSLTQTSKEALPPLARPFPKL